MAGISKYAIGQSWKRQNVTKTILVMDRFDVKIREESDLLGSGFMIKEYTQQKSKFTNWAAKATLVKRKELTEV